MNGDDSASSRSVRRSRRPQTRLETSCTRTGRPGRCLRRKSVAGRREKVGHTARVYVSEESHSGIVPMNHSNKDGRSLAESEEGRLLIKENTLPSGTYPTLSGTAPVPQVGECADSGTLGRHPSEIRTGCANERPSGSVRGAISNDRPYRDLIDPSQPILNNTVSLYCQ